MGRWSMLAALLVGLSALSQAPEAGEGKLQVPAEEKRKEAEATIRDVYKAEFLKSVAADQLSLAAELFKQAEKVKEAPAEYYQLLFMAQDIASRQGDVKLAVSAIETLCGTFECEGIRLRENALAAAGRAPRAKEAVAELAAAYLDLAGDALKAEDFDAAQAACEQSRRYARSNQDAKLATAADQGALLIAERKRAYLAVAADHKKLENAPDDAGANSRVGRYYFCKALDWDKGLAFLAKASEQNWAAAAQADLKNPAEPAARVDLAEKWWSLAESLPPADQEPLKYRAAHWYNRVVQDVGGLTKVKIEKRLATLDLARLAFLESGRSGRAQFGIATSSETAKVPEAKQNFRPSAEEMKELISDAAAAKSGDMKLRGQFWALHTMLGNRLSADPTRWANEDFATRVEVELEMNNAAKRALGENFNFGSSVMNAWPEFAASAKTRDVFLARLRDLPAVVKRYDFRQPAPYTSEKTRNAIDKYCTRNQQALGSKTAKVQLCQWLKDNGIEKAAVDSYAATLDAK